MRDAVEQLRRIEATPRVEALRRRTLEEERYVSVEQARLITRAWREYADKPVMLRRAHAFRLAAAELPIEIDQGEGIVGNRSARPGAGIVFPEGGIGWLEREIDDLPTRPQDKFLVREEDRRYFFDELVPFWKGKTLEDQIDAALDPEIAALEVVGKLNQKDHAQGHICPSTQLWLQKGPAGLLAEAKEKLAQCHGASRDYYEATCIVLEAACTYIRRYGDLAENLSKAGDTPWHRQECPKIAAVCRRIAEGSAQSFRDALQLLWFLFVLLQMESNASSFSPGRADQYLLPYLQKDLDNGALTLDEAMELLDLLFIKFNHIVYLRNTKGAAFFAGFPIGFNMAMGGQHLDGSDAVNLLSYMMLRAQEHVRMRQPNLSARLHRNSPDLFVRRCAEVISLGTGMPQILSDESVIPALQAAGYAREDAVDYCVVGCVELSTHGNALGFSDAGMFNIVKALELTLNDGVCLQTGKQLGLKLGALTDFGTYGELEGAFVKQLDFFIEKMERGLQVVERFHPLCMPSPFLSATIADCLEKGLDVTAGGARYNLSGVQLIQVANLADSLAAVKALCYDSHEVDRGELLGALRENYPGEGLRLRLLNRAPKFGNDIPWVDEIARKYVEYFKAKMDGYSNYRGGDYTVGLYTVSAHVPMGLGVGATPDGRKSGEPLADGGMSAVYGRDQEGPTAMLHSVSRVGSDLAANGTLLNMKFAPQMFRRDGGLEKFIAMLRSFVELGIHHVQFNVVNREDLLAARENPEQYRHLLVRVAGYTANYVDLSQELQDEIIARTEFGG